MTDDELRDALQLVERPVALPAEFNERVLRAMLAELDAEHRVPALPKRRRLQVMRLRPTLGVAAALVLVILATTLVMVTRQAPSALAALQEARAQFRTLPAYHARTAVSANEDAGNPDFEARWETEDWYRDRDTWRTTILASNNASIGQPGDYQVLAGGLYGQYRTEANVFTVTPVADRDDGRPDSPALFFDPSLQWWSTGGPGDPSRPSDQFFEKDCSASDATYIGREATRLHCPAEPRDIELWLDDETGMLLRISVFDITREITSIEFNPDAPAGTFDVGAPEGAKRRWGGKGTAPPEYQVPLGSDVAARYQIVAGDTAAMTVAAVSRSGIWIVVIRCGQQGCNHQLVRVDPKTGKVIATIEPPEPAFINDVEEVDGDIWVSMTERKNLSGNGGGLETAFVQRLDLTTNRLTGRRIDTGQQGGALVAVAGELWSTGGATREVTIGPAQTQYQRVARVNPTTGQVTQIDLDGGAGGSPVAGDGFVWVATSKLNEGNPRQTDYAVVAIDPATNTVVRRLAAPGYPNLVTFANGRLYSSFQLFEAGSERWFVGSAGPTATTFSTSQIAGAGAELGPGVLAAGTLWLPSFLRDEVLKVDPASLQVTGAVATGQGPSGIGTGLGSVWVTNGKEGTLVRIDVG